MTTGAYCCRRRFASSTKNATSRGMGPGVGRDDSEVSPLWFQDRRAGRCPAFQIDMCSARVLQCVSVVDRHVQLPVDDGGKQSVGALQRFGALADIVVELWSGRKQRTMIVEFGN